MVTIKVLAEEYDAIIAGLRLLMNSLDQGTVSPDDGDIGAILTDAGMHEGLDAAGVDALCDRLQGGG